MNAMTNQQLLDLLHQEVVPAIGCTEPIAVALCVARAKELLAAEPESITVSLSKNVYKNAFAVGIPNTGMTGLPIAIALGATVGKSEYMLEVLRDATPEAVAYAKEYMIRVPAKIKINYESPSILYIHAEVTANGQTAQATIIDQHTNFVTTNSEASSPLKGELEGGTSSPLKGELEGVNLRRVYDFATSIASRELDFLLNGAEMNTAAAETSFADQYGHGLGRLLRANTLTATPEMEKLFGNTLFTKIISYTCGACDARMSGAMVQVMSNSGSGNQGTEKRN